MSRALPPRSRAAVRSAGPAAREIRTRRGRARAPGAGEAKYRARHRALHWALERPLVPPPRGPRGQEEKPAEFLVYDVFPWHLVERIGVMSISVKKQADAALATCAHHPPVEVHRNWYY
jgi:hypothetical protein